MELIRETRNTPLWDTAAAAATALCSHGSQGADDSPHQLEILAARSPTNQGSADNPSQEEWPIALQIVAGSLSGGRTTDRDISARRMVWCQQRAGSPRQPLQACAGGQASETRSRRLELLLQLLLSWRDAMRLQACVVRPRMWILVRGNPAQQRLGNEKESDVA